MDAKQETWPPSHINGHAIAETHQQASKQLGVLMALWGDLSEYEQPQLQAVQALALINIGNQLTRLADLAEHAAGQP